MREIKFRGKSTTDGQWIHGSLTVYPFDECFIISHGVGIKVYTETVGQFTGHKDKNGDEIYEGHILKYENPKYPNHKPYVIRWSDEECGFECVNKSNFMSPSVLCEMEIIGNVFEQPDLVDQDVIMDIYSFDRKEVK